MRYGYGAPYDEAPGCSICGRPLVESEDDPNWMACTIHNHAGGHRKCDVANPDEAGDHYATMPELRPMRSFEARARLLGVAASCMASEYYFQHALPGPNDDAEMQYNDERLLEAARDLVDSPHEAAWRDAFAWAEDSTQLEAIRAVIQDDWFQRNSMTMAECVRLILQERDDACAKFESLLGDYRGMERDWLAIGDENAELEAKVNNQYAAEVANRETRKAEGRAWKAETNAAKYKKALELIVKEHGAVCDEFTTCDHRACNSSCGSWLIANDALPGEN